MRGKLIGKLSACVMVIVGVGIGVGSVDAGHPMPQGTSTTTISYDTTGPVSVSGDRDFSGVGPTDASVLVGADNVKIFNSVNGFGRRMIVGGVVGAHESLITHAFFKSDIDTDYFPGLVSGGALNLEFSTIQFDRPVTVDRSTAMLHVLWNADQVDVLDNFYIHLSNHHTLTDPFRDFGDFFGLLFFELPSPNFAIEQSDIVWTISGEGTDVLDVSVTFPYARLQSLEEQGQPVPVGLPAPHGFLEPFHFHVEYIVVDAMGDADADGDVDLGDVAGLQNCMGTAAPGGSPCRRLDTDPDDFVDALDITGVLDRMTGPK